MDKIYHSILQQWFTFVSVIAANFDLNLLKSLDKSTQQLKGNILLLNTSLYLNQFPMNTTYQGRGDPNAF